MYRADVEISGAYFRWSAAEYVRSQPHGALLPLHVDPRLAPHIIVELLRRRARTCIGFFIQTKNTRVVSGPDRSMLTAYHDIWQKQQ